MAIEIDFTIGNVCFLHDYIYFDWFLHLHFHRHHHFHHHFHVYWCFNYFGRQGENFNKAWMFIFFLFFIFCIYFLFSEILFHMPERLILVRCRYWLKVNTRWDASCNSLENTGVVAAPFLHDVSQLHLTLVCTCVIVLYAFWRIIHLSGTLLHNCIVKIFIIIISRYHRYTNL